MAKAGDLSTAFRDAQIVTADYRVALGVHAGIETMTATAARRDDGLAMWMPTLAPGPARAAPAATLGNAEARVAVHPTVVLGGAARRARVWQYGEESGVADRVKQK